MSVSSCFSIVAASAIHPILPRDHIDRGMAQHTDILNSAMRGLRSIQLAHMETHMSDLDQFRRETRAWLEANCPPEMRKPMTADGDTFWGGRNAKFSSEPQRVWFERMRDRGWTVPHWRKEYGGGGLDPEQANIVRQEMAG